LKASAKKYRQDAMDGEEQEGKRRIEVSLEKRAI